MTAAGMVYPSLDRRAGHRPFKSPRPICKNRCPTTLAMQSTYFWRNSINTRVCKHAAFHYHRVAQTVITLEKSKEQIHSMCCDGSLTNFNGSELHQLRESKAQQPNDNKAKTCHLPKLFYANGYDSLKLIKNGRSTNH